MEHGQLSMGSGVWGVGCGVWGSGRVGCGVWGSGEVGKWGSGEIELKPQNPKTPKPQHLKPVSCLLSPVPLLLGGHGSCGTAAAISTIVRWFRCRRLQEENH
ncbi:MAG: hypothetical protein EWV82_16260 [Microcystis aeruginosa Ma_AC_P_19900807_S299]|nr:MAG: hypothetical protein EWV82_16260 [Microcystis aeruginosa Ma_AC_P_19900807_S299]